MGEIGRLDNNSVGVSGWLVEGGWVVVYMH